MPRMTELGGMWEERCSGIGKGDRGTLGGGSTYGRESGR